MPNDSGDQGERGSDESQGLSLPFVLMAEPRRPQQAQEGRTGIEEVSERAIHETAAETPEERKTKFKRDEVARLLGMG